MISYKKLYRIFVWILFLSFMVLYVAQKGGYYEDLNNKKATLTQEKIKQFEEDVKNGEEIKSLWTGGLAGKADKGTGQNEKEESIKNVTVKNLNIDGTTTYVGGIVGEYIKKLDECNVYTANVKRHKCRRNCRKSY